MWIFFYCPINQFSSVQSLSRVRLFATPWTTARQASLSITNSQSLLKLMSIQSVMPSSHLILCRPLLLLPPIPPSIRVFSNESTLCMRWPKYWSFSFNISPSNEYSGLICILIYIPNSERYMVIFMVFICNFLMANVEIFSCAYLSSIFIFHQMSHHVFHIFSN